MKKNRLPYSTMSNLRYLFRNLWAWDKIVLLYALLQAITGVLIPAFGIYFPKFLIDKIQFATSPQSFVLSILIATLFLALLHFTSSFSISHINAGAMFNRMQYLVLKNVKVMDCDYGVLESAAGQSKMQKAINATFGGDSGAATVVRTMGALVASVVGFFLYSGVLSTLNPVIMILLTLSSLSHFFVLRAVDRYVHNNKDNWAPIDKKLRYLEVKSQEFASGKDIRLYAMKHWFLDNFNHFLGKRLFWFQKMAKRQYFSVLSDAVVALLRDGFAYFYLIYVVTMGMIGVSDFVLFFGAIAGFSAFVTGIIQGISTINHANLDLCDIREFLDLPDQSRRTGGKAVPKCVFEIKFEDVSFRYSEDSEDIIKNFSLTIRAGEKIAIVGANGAGKTTLIKLLCGFYTPTKGSILLNGIPLTEFNRDDVYSLFSAVFQDPLVLPFSVAENISMMKADKLDRAWVSQCLELAGLSKRLPDMDAILLKVLKEDGIELSGGELQKLMLARAIYKGAPALLLDEPTAALDPIAESELYQKYHKLVEDKTSIFISHRLASTSFCDRIVFIENGVIAELGSHQELLSQNGGYTTMFEIQSHYYQKEGAEFDEESKTNLEGLEAAF